ncbi:hypothetical protein HYX16_05570 [Candidatus Woesearchaeota archaeon]|nr:hypothetical protein [Candidatus Woesearchaeota archaeon]
MKVTKTVKYNYKLTEEILERDIDEFINEARKGCFSWDSKHANIGLRIIRQYFRILQEKFDNNKLKECLQCYHKLILFLFDSSTGKDKADFDYEDLLAKVSNNFDKFINNYFICLVKTCNIEELSEKIAEYASKLQEYGFESDKNILLENLNEEQLKELGERLLTKLNGITKKDKDKHYILYFLLDLVEKRKDKDKYMQLVNKFEGILDNEEVKYLREEYGED